MSLFGLCGDVRCRVGKLLSLTQLTSDEKGKATNFIKGHCLCPPVLSKAVGIADKD